MAILNVLVGFALLFFGRKVFWLFVAGAGFVAGMSLAASTFNGPEWLSITIGLVIGLIAALLAVFVQHFAIGLAGFLAGGYIAMQILPMLNLEGGWISWTAFIIGGIIGVILVGVFLDWALIILSSLAGSSLLIEAIGLPQVFSVLGFILLVAIGISVQAKDLKKEKR
jgi:hypothetical protein